MVAADQNTVPVLITRLWISIQSDNFRQSRWPSSRDVLQAVVRHPVLLSEWWEHTFIFLIAVKANILSVGLFAHYEPDRRAAEAQKDVTALDFSQVFNGCDERKSHSCEFFQLQVSLAENSTQQRTSKTLLHTVFHLDSSLHVLGFKVEFVRLWVAQNMKTNISFQLRSNANTFWKWEFCEITKILDCNILHIAGSSSTGNYPLYESKHDVIMC